MTKSELINKAMDILTNDDEAFVEAVNELDSYNGFADGYRCYEMSEIDYMYDGLKISDFLDRLTNDFCKDDNYFFESIYGIESTNDVADVYRNNTDAEEVLDELIYKYSHIDLYNAELDEIIEALANEDYSEGNGDWIDEE